jgi:hypothetical protein
MILCVLCKVWSGNVTAVLKQAMYKQHHEVQKLDDVSQNTFHYCDCQWNGVIT